jgi:hypothetical protein
VEPASKIGTRVRSPRVVLVSEKKQGWSEWEACLPPSIGKHQGRHYTMVQSSRSTTTLETSDRAGGVLGRFGETAVSAALEGPWAIWVCLLASAVSRLTSFSARQRAKFRAVMAVVKFLIDDVTATATAHVASISQLNCFTALCEVFVASMSTSLCIRGRAFRLPLLFPLRRATAIPCSHAQWPCRLRCNSTFSPTNIAALLNPPTLSPTSPQLRAPSGEILTINGFVRSVRKQKRVAFAAIGDGSTLKTVQAVFSPEQADGSVDSFKPSSQTDA